LGDRKAMLTKALNYILYDMPLYRKVVFLVLVLFLIPYLTFSIIIFYQYKNITDNSIIDSTVSVVNQFHESVNFKITMYNNLLEKISIDKKIHSILALDKNEYENNIFEISKGLSDQIKSLTYLNIQSGIYRITIYSANNDILPDGNSLSNMNEAGKKEWYNEKILAQPCQFTEKDVFNNKNLLCFTRPIVSTETGSLLKVMGFVKIDVYSDFVFNADIEILQSKKNNFVIFNEKSEIIYQNNILSKDLTTAFENFKNNNGNVLKPKVSGKNIFIDLPFEEFKLNGVFLYNFESLQTRDIWIQIIIFVFIFILVMFLLFVFIFKKYSDRIRNILEKTMITKEGRFVTGESIKGSDEISTLDNHFSEMISQINLLIDQNYIKTIHEREAQINALQSQINPHFLFNTLQIIDALALEDRCAEVSELIQKLGDMFRYNIDKNSNKYVKFSEELNSINNYFYILNVRFPDKFEIYYDIQEGTQDIYIIKFILQPIVENCFQHAFYGLSHKWEIKIKAKLEDNILFISVADNGIGMKEDKLKILINSINENYGNPSNEYTKIGIGLKNINKRLVLGYGDEYKLEIFSSPDKGTEVIIKIPAENRRIDDVKTSGC
jgi:two-component system sensor histidine kinase YesM